MESIRAQILEGDEVILDGVDVWINEEPDAYGNDASEIQSQSKEDREKGISKNYIGNGKKLFGWSTTKTETNVDLHTAAEPF